MILAEPIAGVFDRDYDQDFDPAGHLRARIKMELEAGERLIWAAEPAHGPVAATRDGLRLLGWTTLGSLGGGIALIGARLLIGPSADILENLAALSILLGIGAAMLTVAEAGGRLVGRLAPSRRPLYALTDRRAIIWTPVAGTRAVEVRTIPRHAIRPEWIRRIQYPDGSGHLLFLPANSIPKGFRGLADVRAVDVLLRRHLVRDASPVVAAATKFPPIPDPDAFEEPF